MTATNADETAVRSRWRRRRTRRVRSRGCESDYRLQENQGGSLHGLGQV